MSCHEKPNILSKVAMEGVFFTLHRNRHKTIQKCLITLMAPAMIQRQTGHTAQTLDFKQDFLRLKGYVTHEKIAQRLHLTC